MQYTNTSITYHDVAGPNFLNLQHNLSGLVNTLKDFKVIISSSESLDFLNHVQGQIDLAPFSSLHYTKPPLDRLLSRHSREGNVYLESPLFVFRASVRKIEIMHSEIRIIEFLTDFLHCHFKFPALEEIHHHIQDVRGDGFEAFECTLYDTWEKLQDIRILVMRWYTGIEFKLEYDGNPN